MAYETEYRYELDNPNYYVNMIFLNKIIKLFNKVVQ